MNKVSFFTPIYKPPAHIVETLKKSHIIDEQETPQHMIKRVCTTLFEPERKFGTSLDDTKHMMRDFAQLMSEGYVLPGTPTLTNAGRRVNAALSSCAVIPLKLRRISDIKDQIIAYYKQNIGSGFDLTSYQNPLDILRYINTISKQETATGKYDRYIGNMGTLHISHPQIREFVHIKRSKDMKHFNISVDMSESFMESAIHHKTFTLTDGSIVNAHELLMEIAESAWLNGDPGILFMERMNRDNPVSESSPYISTPPCSEMGLASGETCQFGYINVHRFVLRDTEGNAQIDYEKLASSTELLTRVLDNAITYSTDRFPTELSVQIAKLKRKIGIGICGLSDLLLEFDLPYESAEARILARDVLSFINYRSKTASSVLAKQRGPCGAMVKMKGNRYFSKDFLGQKYAVSPTNTVSSEQWIDLAEKISVSGNLRNILTTALPPTGRASIILGTTPSIEPYFSFFSKDGSIKPAVYSFLFRHLDGNTTKIDQAVRQAKKADSFQSIESLPALVRACLKRATEIHPNDHLKMTTALAGINGVVDESASKTINLPSDATVKNVYTIFVQAYKLGLKNISVYRNNSRDMQPETL